MPTQIYIYIYIGTVNYPSLEHNALKLKFWFPEVVFNNGLPNLKNIHNVYHVIDQFGIQQQSCILKKKLMFVIIT